MLYPYFVSWKMLVLPKIHGSRSGRAAELTAALFTVPFMLNAQNYTAVLEHDSVKLADARAHIEVSIAPSFGNLAYAMKVNGQGILWSPSLEELKARPTLAGNPFLSPWANRLDHDGFWANGRAYQLNKELKNIRHDGNGLPIHGLVSFTDKWKVTSHGADADSAWVTSRLEFWREPAWMAQFPFAHAIEMTYRLSGGALEIRTVYENLSAEPMPLVIGFHPYFTIPGASRDEWQVHLAARDHVELSKTLTPTGQRVPVERTDFALKGVQLDDVYDNLVRDANGAAVFSVSSGERKISVLYGPNFNTAVVYAPPGRNFICFEPMTGITNGANLAHEGKYTGLQSVPAGGRWQESFWIRATGF